MAKKIISQDVEFYTTTDGYSPYLEWYNSIDDPKMRGIIGSRVSRVRGGNWGDCKSLGSGLFELRIHVGPGYRIYFGQQGRRLVVLLWGGDKHQQLKDIHRAHGYWLDYKERKK